MINKDVSSGSPERFGYEWKRYSQIDPNYEKQFLAWTPFFEKEDWAEKRFLDVGCGMGRNSYWPMKYGAKGGVSIDVDDRSLDAAKLNLSKFPDVEVVKCSAYDIHYRSEFDVVFSIGVIHHLSDPDRAVANMTLAAKAGGTVMVWVYGKENNEKLVAILDPLRKNIFSKLPISLLHHLSLYPTIAVYCLVRLFSINIEYYRQIKKYKFKHLRSIIFDQMLPKIANYWSRSEVRDLMHRAGLNEVQLAHVNEMSWCAIGKKAV